MTTPEERLVAGETLEGAEAQEMMGKMLGEHPWQFWGALALEYLRQDQPKQAERILEELLEGRS